MGIRWCIRRASPMPAMSIWSGPRGVYDEAKRYAEALVMAYHRQHGMETRIVRIFNTYGPRMRLDDGRVVPNFIGQAIRGEALDHLRRRLADALLSNIIDDLVEGVVQACWQSDLCRSRST